MAEAWDIEGTDQFADWYGSLDDHQQKAVETAVEKLAEVGPALGRPLVGEIVNELMPHLKELIPPGGNLRILFTFDPRRTGILLVGGDKTGNWKGWYREAIQQAARLYVDYLKETGQK